MDETSSAQYRRVFIILAAAFTFAFFFCATVADAQQLTQTWANIFDGAAHGPDVAYAIAADASDNSYVTGEACVQLPFDPATGSCQQTDLAIVKYDVNGNPAWSEMIPTPGNFAAGTAVTLDTLGNVYVAGFGQTGQLAPDGTPFIEFVTAKYDSSGTQQWVQYFQGGGTDYGGPNAQDGPARIAVDATGNSYITGFVSNSSGASGSIYTIKYSSSGAQLWARVLNPAAVLSSYTTAIPRGLAVDALGDVYITASVGNGAFGQGLTLKYDTNGNQLWSQIFGPAQQADQLGQPYFNTAIALDAAGNAYVAAYGGGLNTGQLFTPDTAYAIKYSPNGTQMWQTQYLTPSGYGNITAGIAVDALGNVYVTGMVADAQPTSSSPTDFDTLKFDANGTFLWEERYNDNGDGKDSSTGIALDAAGSAYVTGQSTSPSDTAGQNYATVEYDPNGNQLSVNQYNGPANGNDIPSGIAAGSSFVFVTGTSFVPSNVSDSNSADWATLELQPADPAFTAEAGHQNPAVSFSPRSLSFGNQTAGTTSAAQTTTLTNSGNATLTMGTIAITGSGASDFKITANTCTANLAPRATCKITVAFTPATGASFTAAISVPDNAPGSPQTVALSGTGTAPPAPSVSFSPTSLTFSPQAVGTTSASQSVTLKNTGGAPLTINAITITGTNAADFKAINITCESSLAVGANCVITVAFAPLTPGNKTAQVSATDNASGSPQTLALSGVTPDFAISVASGSSASATVMAGQTATYNLQLAPSNLTGTVALACSGAPAGAACSVSPASITVSGNTATAIAVSVTTTARPASSSILFGTWNGIPWSPIAVLLLAGLPFTKRSNARLRAAFAFACLLLIVSLASCGGTAPASTSTGTNPGGSPPASGTPAGTSTLTITATAGQVAHTLPLSLTVN